MTTILAHGIVVTCDRFHTCGRYHLAIGDGRILSLSQDLAELTSSYPGSAVVDATEKFILPGFVNPHFHSESLLHAGRTRGRHLRSWSADQLFIEASERLRASHEDLRVLYRYASSVLLRYGVTTVGEYTVPSDEEGFRLISDAIRDAGVKPVLSLPNWESVSALRLMGSTRPAAYVDLGKEQDYTMYSFQSLANLAREEHLPTTAHIAETREDGEIIRKNFTRTPLKTLEEYGVLQPGCLVVHGNHLPSSDLDILQRLRIPVAVCPRSTAYKQTGYPSLRALIGGELIVGVGTDWGEPDILRELRFLADLPYLVPDLPRRAPSDLLRMVTLHAAHCLGIAQETGSLEAGKKADLTMIDPGRSIHALEVSSADAVVDGLLHECSSARVTDVMIDGEFFLKDARVLTLDEGEVQSAMAGLIARYYPAPAMHAGSQKQDSPPFAGQTPTTTEGFEEGFSVVGPVHGNTIPFVERQPPGQQSVPSTQKSGRPVQQPELSKNVRRIFGDDDES